jgi:hypothetical protein
MRCVTGVKRVIVLGFETKELMQIEFLIRLRASSCLPEITRKYWRNTRYTYELCSSRGEQDLISVFARKWSLKYLQLDDTRKDVLVWRFTTSLTGLQIFKIGSALSAETRGNLIIVCQLFRLDTKNWRAASIKIGSILIFIFIQYASLISNIEVFWIQ